MTLAGKHCVPCEGGAAPLKDAEVQDLLRQVSGWQAGEGKIHKSYTFADFAAAMSFLNRVAEVAEAEGHHPDFSVHYNRVEMTIWTHAAGLRRAEVAPRFAGAPRSGEPATQAGGLTENDFILAARIDDLLKDRG